MCFLMLRGGARIQLKGGGGNEQQNNVELISVSNMYSIQLKKLT
jgi:hypothetical protein